MAKRDRNTGKVSQFRSEEEEAEFWSVHSPLEFPEESEEVEVQVSRPLKSVLSIRLDPEYRQQLREIARHYGVGPTTLARMFIVASINAYRERGSLEPLSHLSQNTKIKG